MRLIDCRLGDVVVVPYLGAKLSIYQSVVYIPIHTYGHQLWAMPGRIRLWMQVVGLTVWDWVRSLKIQEGFRVDPQLLHIEWSEVRWFGHLIRIPPWQLPLVVYQAWPAGWRPCEQTQDLLKGLDLQAGLGAVGDLNEPAGDGEASLFSQLLPWPWNR